MQRQWDRCHEITNMTAFVVFYGLAMLCGWICLYRVAMRQSSKTTTGDGIWFGAGIAFFLSLWLHVMLINSHN